MGNDGGLMDLISQVFSTTGQDFRMRGGYHLSEVPGCFYISIYLPTPEKLKNHSIKRRHNRRTAGDFR